MQFKDILNKYLKEMGIKYSGNPNRKGISHPNERTKVNKYLTDNMTTSTSSTVIRKKLIEEGIKEEKCECCGRCEWMGRKTNKKELIGQINMLRERIPDITLRTTLICGFPGETQEAHEELMQFINDMEFDRLGAFTYSPEEGTKAAVMDNQIDEEVKSDWPAFFLSSEALRKRVSSGILRI